MLSKEDLIYLGTVFMISGESAKNGVSYVGDYDINKALDLSKKIFNKVFCGDNKEVIMINE